MYDFKKEHQNVYLSPAPPGLEQEFKTLLTPEAIGFLVDLNLHFQKKIDHLYSARLERKSLQKKNNRIPKFFKPHYTEGDWTIAPVSKFTLSNNISLNKTKKFLNCFNRFSITFRS